MGRRRTRVDRDAPLPEGLYRHGKQYRARLLGGPWTYFGDDYPEACKGYAAWRREGCNPDTIGWLLDLFTGAVCAGKVRAGQLAKRTAKDYSRDAEILKAGIGHFGVKALKPQHIAEFRDARAQDAPRHVRNELACLSAAMSWAVESGKRDDNPCLQVERPSRKRRMRLITDAEYLKVYPVASASVRRAMVLGVRTLALPDDLLAMGPRDVFRLANGKRVLRYERGKTGNQVEIELVGELAQLVDECLGAEIVWPTFVHKGRGKHNGKRYTVDGIGAMFRRYCGKEKADVADFGLRDLRAKGATDMYRAGIDIRQIQKLLGHSSVQTTEIYIKDLIPETVRPNEQPIIAEAK